ncbi:MAG: aminopeptidase [Rhodobacteraceae bacterium]|nr:aminopeptidase [Paracoccaceae bacterium]
MKWFAMLALAFVAGGCSTYYGQAIRGQWQLLNESESIAKLIARTNTPPELRGKLELVLSLREFAERELKLQPDRHYRRYADIDRRFVVWNVYAAPEFSLEDKTWWYPVVGSLSYRGYFREDLARRRAEALAADGWDVHVGGVEAYSTLGWFRDPVLNTFIYQEPADLAETLFHELAHQRVFISGDTDFNEAFATAVAEAGVRRWLAATDNTVALAEYERAARRETEFVELLSRTRTELKALYAQTNTLTADQMRDGKTNAFARLRERQATLKQSWNGATDYDGWFAQPMNNALLNTVDTYHHLVPGFTALLHQHSGNLDAFYRAVRALGRLPQEERHRRLREMAP